MVFFYFPEDKISENTVVYTDNSSLATQMEFGIIVDNLNIRFF